MIEEGPWDEKENVAQCFPMQHDAERQVALARHC